MNNVLLTIIKFGRMARNLILSSSFAHFPKCLCFEQNCSTGIYPATHSTK
jgi:hypothetical protein